MIGRFCVVGVGLIGGSLARDLRRLGLVGEIVGTGRNPDHLRRAVELGIVDRYTTDLALAVQDADMILLSVPLGAMAGVLQALKGRLPEQAVITDAGSAKQSILQDAISVFGTLPTNLVPGHPIAGTEHSGVEATLEGLFENHRVILTPDDTTAPEAVAAVRAMWQAVGAEVLCMSAKHHDEVLAATSHLPHMLAYTLVDVLGRMEESREIFRYAAGGFRDFTRIASSDPQMWHDVCIANREALVGALEHFEHRLAAAIEAIRNGDGEAVRALFVRAKALRDRHTETREQ